MCCGNCKAVQWLCTSISIMHGSTALLHLKVGSLVFLRFACSFSSLNWRAISAFSSCKWLHLSLPSQMTHTNTRHLRWSTHKTIIWQSSKEPPRALKSDQFFGNTTGHTAFGCIGASLATERFDQSGTARARLFCPVLKPCQNLRSFLPCMLFGWYLHCRQVMRCRKSHC